MAKQSSKQANKVDLFNMAIESANLMSAKVGDAQKAILEFIKSMVAISPTWHEVKTFDPAKKADASLLDQNINKIRLHLKGREIARGYDASHADDLWNKCKREYRKQLDGKVTESKIGEGSTKRETKRSKDTMFADSALEYAAYIAAQSVSKAGLSTFQSEVRDLLRDLSKIITKHKVASK